MTLAMKNSPETNSLGKAGAHSQNSENNPGQSSRCNPVCLEVSVNLRSLPAEAGGPSQSIREEGKSVIVFDNGAILRIANNLPIGQTVILSNPNGREVVCRAVSGRKLPSVKGYVEVEFIEPIKDFWGIHQDAAPVAAATQSVTPLGPREAPVLPPPLLPRAAAPSDAPAKAATVPMGRGPTFEDIPGLLSAPPSNGPRESKTQAAGPGPEKVTKDDSDYNFSEVTQPTSVASWRPPDSELPAEKRGFPAAGEASSMTSAAGSPVKPRDFMGKGLTSYEQPRSSPKASNWRTPLIVGVAAFALAGVCAVVFFMHRGTTTVSIAKTVDVSQPSMPESPGSNNAHEPVRARQEASAQVSTQTEAQTQVQSVAVDRAQSMAGIAPVPAVVTSPETPDLPTGTGVESRNARRQDENAMVTNQLSLSSSSRSAIPNLKMGSPSAPNRNPANLSEGPAPITEIASTEAVGGTPPAGLLTAAGRSYNPPAPPPSAPTPAPVVAVMTVRDPKLISSTRLVYPTTARQSHIEGTVTVSASIDEYGKVVGAKALSGPMLLRQAAVESVNQWKYSPRLIDGKAAPSQVTVNVEFRLN